MKEGILWKLNSSVDREADAGAQLNDLGSWRSRHHPSHPPIGNGQQLFSPRKDNSSGNIIHISYPSYDFHIIISSLYMQKMISCIYFVHLISHVKQRQSSVVNISCYFCLICQVFVQASEACYSLLGLCLVRLTWSFVQYVVFCVVS